MTNGKVTKDGSNYEVEFSEGGALTRFSKDSAGKVLYQEYQDIAKGSKLTFNSKWEVVKADIQTLKKGTFYLNGQVYEVSPGTQLKFENGKVSVNVKGGSFTYYPEKDTSNKKTISDIKDGGEFTIDNKGEITSAKFEASKESTFKIKGYTYKLPEGAKVDFKDNKISITLPDGKKVEAPEVDKDADSSFVTEFTSESGKIILPNGDTFESASKTLSWDKDGFYFSDQYSGIKNDKGQEDFKIENKAGNKVYLVFDKSKIPEGKDSIFLGVENGKNSLILTSKAGKGPAIFFTETNRYGIEITAQNTAAVQANKGKVFVEQADPGKIASIKISGESITTLDSRSFLW